MTDWTQVADQPNVWRCQDRHERNWRYVMCRDDRITSLVASKINIATPIKPGTSPLPAIIDILNARIEANDPGDD